MKYKCSIEINKSLEELVKLWEDEDNFPFWQDGFHSIELLEGEKGRINSKSRILLNQGKRKMELIETILLNDLPHNKKALYEHKHMTNTQSSSFQSLGNNKCLYISEVEYLKFNGLMPKLMSKLFPGLFKKQSEKWMRQFKQFAENH